MDYSVQVRKPAAAYEASRRRGVNPTPRSRYIAGLAGALAGATFVLVYLATHTYSLGF